MEIVCHRVKLKPGSVERARRWAAEFNRRPQEVRDWLVGQGVALECAFLEQTAEGDYLIIVLKGAHIGHAPPSSLPIAAYHREFVHEAWEAAAPLETLFTFDLQAGE